MVTYPPGEWLSMKWKLEGMTGKGTLPMPTQIRPKDRTRRDDSEFRLTHARSTVDLEFPGNKSSFLIPL